MAEIFGPQVNRFFQNSASGGGTTPSPNPMMQMAMQMMSNNPDLIRSALENNPALAGQVDPETAQQVNFFTTLTL